LQPRSQDTLGANGGNTLFYGVAVSNDCTYITTVTGGPQPLNFYSGRIMYSNNAGSTFTQTTGGVLTDYFTGCAVSYNGQIQVAISYSANVQQGRTGGIYYATAYKNWDEVNGNYYQFYTSVAMNPSGV
jgi:hypothetical protein